MANTAGIPLVELFSVTDQVNAVLPQAIQDFLAKFSVARLRSLSSPGAIVHHGSLQPILPAFADTPPEFDIGIGTLSVPLLNTGLPFQIAMTRAAVTGTLEPAASAWRLDISLADFVLTLTGLQSATFVKESGTTPRHLLRDPVPRPVRIIGAATLRIQKSSPGADVQVLFVDSPDPLDPTAPTGAVAELVFSPPHFFLGGSEVGLSVGKLVFDASESFSPPQVLERGQGPAWVGLALQEATVYAPRNLPVVGDLSGGVKNVLLGRPMGVQGEFELQFGRTALDPATFQFFQDPGDIRLGITGAGTARIVTVEGNQDDTFTIRAGFTLPAPPGDGTLVEWRAEWRFPDAAVIEGDSATGVVRHGETLKVTPIEIVTVDGTPEPFSHPEITFRFIVAGAAPSIRAQVNGQDIENTIHLAGPVDAVNGVLLTAVATTPGPSEFTWEILGHGGATTGQSFRPDFSGLQNGWTIKLTQVLPAGTPSLTSHLAVTLVEVGRLLIGAEGGVFDSAAPTVALDLTAVDVTFSLTDFHARGTFVPVLEDAELDASLPAKVRVPPDSFARVAVAEGGAPPTFDFDRHVQILMDFEKTTVLGWGELRPAGAAATPGDAGAVQAQLLAWAANYPDARFVVVGRCDDVGSGGSAVPVDETPDAFNIALARSRAARGRSLLTARESGGTGTLIAATDVFTRGETSDWDAGSSAGDTEEERAELALTAAEKSEARTDPALASGWLIKHEFDGRHQGWGNQQNADPDSERLRRQFRRVDIYAATDATPLAGARTGERTAAVAPTLRRSYVPSAGRDPLPVPAADPTIDYRVKLVVGWDNPTAVTFADAVPTLIEAEFAWSPTELTLPPVGGQVPTIDKEVLVVFATWVYDTRTGSTRATLGIRSEGDPEGLFSSPQPNLVMAAALGPMLLSGVDLQDDVIGSGARVAALLAATAVAGINFGGGGPLVGAGSKVAVMSLEAEAQTRALSDVGADYQITLTTDYVTTMHIDGGVLGIKTDPDHPVKIRYKKVGLEFDNTKPDWEKVGLAYATDCMEIEDAGKWLIDGALGELLRIVEVSMGRGSFWIELRVAAGLDLGPVEVTEAIFRLTWTDGSPVPGFELRGFTVTLNVAEVIQGEGRLRIEDGGVIRAGVEATVEALGLGVTAGLAMGRPESIAPAVFLEVFLGVQFSTPLPLAQSGAAIYGFKGMFVANGERTLGTNVDPVGRELDWWQAPPGSKYQPRKDQYAIGVGVVVGTMPDVSFCFSAGGMLVVAFPDLEVILGIDAEIISVPETEVTDEGTQSGNITGLIVINDEGVKIAVLAQYSIPDLLEVKIPFSANFPASLRGSYVRLGSDGQVAHERFGEPVTATLLPGILDAKVWSYLMIEQDGLISLGGDDRFSFEGFSVGFGAGWGIEWSAGPIKLSASAKVLVGFGTDPLLVKGGVFVAGELDLVVLSISARGELILTYFAGEVYLEGEFCGEVDCFFFSIEGCVGVQIGTESAPAPPAPPPPVVSVSLTDRCDRVMGEAAPTSATIAALPLFQIVTSADPDLSSVNEGRPPQDNNTVWADTAPVIHFRHDILDAEISGQFDLDPQPGTADWFGGNRFKYAYRLDNLTLRQEGGAVVTSTGPLQSVWMSTPYRRPDASGLDNPVPSEHEGPNLKLLDWNPWNWAVNLDDGGAGTDGDPAHEVGDLCETFPQPRRACVFGADARAHALLAARMAPARPAPPPYPTSFTAIGEPVLRTPQADFRGRDLQTLANHLGQTLEGGGVVALPFSLTREGRTLTTGLSMPWLRRATPAGFEETPLPWEPRFDRRLTSPVLTLLVCDAPGRPGEVDKVCTDFRPLPASGPTMEASVGGLTLRAVTGGLPFELTDRVDAGVDPAVVGQDGVTDVLLPDSGIDLELSPPAAQVELYFINVKDGRFTLRALDPAGVVVDDAVLSGPIQRPIVVRLSGLTPIARIEVRGGGGNVLLYRLCRLGGGGDPGPDRRCVTFRGRPVDAEVDQFRQDWLTGVAAQPDLRLRFGDVVDQSGSEPVGGRDGSGEPFIPESGLVLTIRGGCPDLELGVIRFNPAEVSATGFDATGAAVATTVTRGHQREPELLRLTTRDGTPIVRVLLEGGANEASLFRVCCLGRGGLGSGDACTDFAEATLADGVSEFAHRGLVFVDPSGRGGLSLDDLVDRRAEPAEPGRDGVSELRFRSGQLVIRPARPARAVRVRLMLFGGPVTGRARSALGATVATARTTDEQSVEQVLTFVGDGIETVELSGGSGEAAIIEVCVTAMPGRAVLGSGRDPFGVGVPAVPASAVPVVTGLVDTAPADAWVGRTLEVRGHCRVVQYQPGGDGTGPWDGVQVVAPTGVRVSLLSICGIDQVQVTRRQEDQAARDDRLLDLTAVLTTAANERRELLLEPGLSYEIAVAWSWAVWESNEDATDSPPPPESAGFTAGPTQTFHFAVASQVIDSGLTQDGLNEYVFDPRDVSRYVALVEPADGRTAQFLDDPVWAHFSAGHVEQLLALYDRVVDLRVSRTDPPPQSSPGALTAVLAPLEATSRQWTALPVTLSPTAYQAIAEATAAAPCLPDGPFGDGSSLAATFALEPLAMYDLVVAAPRTDGSDPMTVWPTRFITSRYAGPDELIEHLGLNLTGFAPFAPADLVIDAAAVIPGGAAETSDALMGTLLAALGADTLPLPVSRPETYVFWRQDGATWVIEGVLLDSLESLYRTGAFLTGTGTAEIGTRFKIAGGRIGRQTLSVHRTTENWTRVFLKPAAPIGLGPGDHTLRLDFEASDGVRTGSRSLGRRPAVLEREGL
jgi:hypothetical protein